MTTEKYGRAIFTTDHAASRYRKPVAFFGELGPFGPGDLMWPDETDSPITCYEPIDNEVVNWMAETRGKIGPLAIEWLTRNSRRESHSTPLSPRVALPPAATDRRAERQP
jgi:hypothetical protein